MFTIICVLVGCMVVFDLLVVFFLSNNDTPAYTPALRRTFLQLTSLDQQLRTLGPPLG